MKTKREFLEAIVEQVESQEIVDFAKVEIEKLDQRNAKRRSSKTAKQKKNDAIKDLILEVLNSKEFLLSSDVALKLHLTSQKASALLQQLAKDEKIMSNLFKVKGRGLLTGYKLLDSQDSQD